MLLSNWLAIVGPSTPAFTDLRWALMSVLPAVVRTSCFHARLEEFDVTPLFVHKYIVSNPAKDPSIAAIWNDAEYALGFAFCKVRGIAITGLVPPDLAVEMGPLGFLQG